MTFAQAQQFVMPLGKHKGKTLDDIASTDEGLKYLDWIVGEGFLWDRTEEAIKTYLADPAIQRDLNALVGD